MDLKRPERIDDRHLDAVQSWMQQQLLHPVRDAHIDTIIRSTSKLSAQQHLAIYQRSYIARLRDCMTRQFPALAYALGDVLFQNFADVFLSEYPSKSYTLADLGRYFAHFLEESRPDSEDSIKESWPDFMIELARFEYQINMAFDEQVGEAPIFFMDNVQKLQWTPVLHLFTHKFPIASYYKAFIAAQEPQLPFEKESYAVLVRRNYKLGLFELKPAQYLFLNLLKESGSMTTAKEKTQSHFEFSDDTMVALWEQWKSIWIQEGFFIAISSA